MDKSPKQSKRSKKKSDVQIKNILTEALGEYLQAHCRKTHDDSNAINATIEEFLRTFLVIGYTFEGEPTIIINAKTQLDADALSSAFTKFFINNVNN
jgi:hypothetical protein